MNLRLRHLKLLLPTLVGLMFAANLPPAMASASDKTALIAECSSSKDKPNSVVEEKTEEPKKDDPDVQLRTAPLKEVNATDDNKQEKSNPADSGEKKQDSQSQGESPKAKRSPTLQGPTASLPKRIASFVAGIIVGVPVASVRRAVSEDKEAGHTVCYEKDVPAIEKAARVILFPLCAISGVIEGTSDAVENSWKYSDTQPFSKNSCSLGKLGPAEE